MAMMGVNQIKLNKSPLKIFEEYFFFSSKAEKRKIMIQSSRNFSLCSTSFLPTYHISRSSYRDASLCEVYEGIGDQEENFVV